MTVRRHGETMFTCSPDELRARIRRIFRDDPIYKSWTESSDGVTFTTTVKPRWWLLGTTMIVRLERRGPRTCLQVDTQAQPWIVGDVFNYYNRYIRDFLIAVGDTPESGN